ncbi:hypothetical protein AALP_AA6G287200 [Arabis alpina]|uniref:Uncharacterized protein n=1 Tax=Arabis alpina TaxID=50452 RepID=A0A087GSC4_ARAAL|nr:hypothetical protein AALP_AA6G287200 [Arabis alpina]
MDLTRPQVEDVVRTLEPDLIFFDFAHWIPQVALEFGAKSVDYLLLSAAAVASLIVQGCELGVPPPGYPSSKVLLHKKDAYSMKPLANSTEDLDAFQERFTASFTKCDVILIKACKEFEGEFCNYVERKFDKKILFTGPMLPQGDTTIPLEERWSNWLMVKPPKGTTTIQEALPEGFEERVKGRGVVWGGWVQQPLILSHASVGCFVSHCGLGSMWESLVSDCQIVLVPHLTEQIINARLMTGELEVSVEVAREETGWFSKESLCDAIESVMNRGSQLGIRVRKNHTRWRKTLTSPGLINGYVDDLIESLNDLIVHGTNSD